MALATKMENLRLKVPFDNFKSALDVQIAEANQLINCEVIDAESYRIFESKSNELYNDLISVWQISFNEPENYFQRQIMLNFKTGLKELQIENPLFVTVNKKKNWLKLLVTNVKHQFDVLSVCDSVVRYNEELDKDYKSLNTEKRLAFILWKLGKLPAGTYYPVREILAGNGIVFDDVIVPHSLLSNLKERGLIEFLGSGEATLTVDGRIESEKIDEGIKTMNNKTTNENPIKKGRIFISHSHKDEDVVRRFCDSILQNCLNINTTTDVFCTSLEGSKPKTGVDFKAQIKDELERAPVVIQFISNDYKASEVCLNEMGAAWVLCDNVFPLILFTSEFEVGFIHYSTQQKHLQNKTDLLAVCDDLQELGIGRITSTARLSTKIDEFVSFLATIDKKRFNVVNKSVYQRDLDILVNYMDAKKYKMVRISKLVETYPIYTKEHILTLINHFPHDLTLTKVKGEDAVQNLLSDFDF